MKLSIVILNYNVRYFLELCLKSVEAAIKNIDAEIIVVDNNSLDDSCQMVQTIFPKVKLIQNKENLGFSKGNNIGVAQAQGEYICILNPDTVVAEDTFSNLLTFADLQHNLGIIGCRLIDGNGKFLPESKRNVPKPMVSVKKIFGNASEYYATQLNQHDTGKVDIMVGAFMLMKRDLYNDLNGFDEDYFMYGEDIDLSYRIHKKGLDNIYMGSETIIHFKGESTLKDIAYAKRFYRAMRIFYKKHFRNYGLFDVVVWIGSRVMPFLKKDRTVDKKKPENYIVVSENKKDVLPGYSQIRVVETYLKDTEYIFDSNTLSFKMIIQQMDGFTKNNSSTFKILPKNSNFILGSNSSKTRGEVQFLE